MALPFKKCTRCKRWLDRATAFTKDASRGDGLSYRCRECTKAYSDESRDRIRAYKTKWRERNPYYHRERTYGLGFGGYPRLLAKQDGRCAICGTPHPGGRGDTFHVDHDHSCCPGSKSCGRCVRGLLCKLCNMGLGRFRDDPALLRAAADYLELADFTELLKETGHHPDST